MTEPAASADHSDQRDGRGEGRRWLADYPAWVPPDLPLPGITAIDQFRATARQAPDAPAVYFFETVISFGELDRLSTGLAAGLIALGLKPGDRVAVWLQNVPQFWLAELAAWKAGAIVVPLNPMFKQVEFTYHLMDSGAQILIGQPSLIAPVVEQLSGLRHVITTDEFELRPAAQAKVVTTDRQQVAANLFATHDLLSLCAAHANADDPMVPLAPPDVALLVYTSGTTGGPKGAMNTHANVAFNAEVFRRWMQLGTGDVIVGAAPLFHVTGLIAHLAAASLTGLPVILAYRFDASELLRLIERWRGTFMIAAITAYIALLKSPCRANARPVVAAQGIQRRRARRPAHCRAVQSGDRDLYSQYLRPDGNDFAFACDAAGRARSGRPGIGRAFYWRAGTQYAGKGGRSG